MTVKIMSGGTAALAVPEKETEKEQENRSDEPVFTAEDLYLSDPAHHAHRRKKRFGFIGVLIFQLCACGLIFAALWALQTFAPHEISEAVKSFIACFA